MEYFSIRLQLLLMSVITSFCLSISFIELSKTINIKQSTKKRKKCLSLKKIFVSLALEKDLRIVILIIYSSFIL